MKFLAVAAIYVAFYGAIALAVYWTRSLRPLWGLLATPTIKGA